MCARRTAIRMRKFGRQRTASGAIDVAAGYDPIGERRIYVYDSRGCLRLICDEQ